MNEKEPQGIVESANWMIDKIENFKVKLGKYELGFHNRTLKFYRIVTLLAIMIFLSVWVYTGYEGTLIRLYPDEELQSLPKGVGIHFGTILFTLGSFLIVSYSIEKVGIKGLRNVLYSFIVASGFINGLFEVTYTIFYDVIHHQAMWINAPFLYNELGLFRLYPTYRNWYWVIFGTILIYVLKNNYKDLDWVWKIKKWKIRYKGVYAHKKVKDFVYKKWVWIGMVLITLWGIWIFFPLPFIQVRNNYFPQYIYGFMDNEVVPEWIPEENIIHLIETDWKAVYVENTGVRIINEITKFMHFVFFTYLLIPRKKIKKVALKWT